LAPGALVLNCTENIGNINIFIIIPTAYQNGPAKNGDEPQMSIFLPPSRRKTSGIFMR
jgi:hypothetical protein